MKHNLMIGGCALSLVLLAVLLITGTFAPRVETASHTMTTSYNWYFKPREDGQQPVVADNAPFIDNYNVRYLGDPDQKILYLTFDSGYENGCTEKILDVLKEKNVPAAFFVTGHYMDSNPDLIRRMEEEGHLVCNHTVHHQNLCAVSAEDFENEVEGLASKYEEITGKAMPKYLRPPEGAYSEQALAYADQLGYTTVFWSFAYKDWLNDDQPDPEASIEKILSRTHNGAILLLHSTSATNAEILSKVIDQWTEQGYTIKSLDELPKKTPVSSASPAPSATS